jgi:hypothetical protein
VRRTHQAQRHPAITHADVAGGMARVADSASPAIVSYRQVVQNGAHAMIGAARSAASLPLALLGAVDTMPQCSYWSTAPSLSNMRLYPYCALYLATEDKLRRHGRIYEHASCV